MTELSPDLKGLYEESHALVGRVGPMFNGAHSFVMMMTLSHLIAQWLLSHNPEHHDQLIQALAMTVEERIATVLEGDDLETRH